MLKPITERGRIFEAWSDEPWTVDGAAVRVSMVCFDGQKGVPARLDGAEVAEVFADLSAARGGTEWPQECRGGAAAAERHGHHSPPFGAMDHRFRYHV
ncbi:hypothetical protein [Paracoccus haematequi]|uniref:hypothetical protein n=1 Tax=Paracoccus haematequi TaxID=2491866 RepID=UPI0013DEC6F9|nr:hypothetical protein [Paracoccus haematequi]